MDMVNCMLLSSGAPENLWDEAILSTCFILNRIPRRDSDVTPYEHWKGRTLNIQFFKVWDCLTKVSILEPKKRKIVPKTVDTIFIGYVLDSKINRFPVVNSEISKISNNTIIKIRDDVYFENIFPLKSRIPCSPSITPSTSDISSSSSAPTKDFEPKRSKRTRILHLSVRTYSPILWKVILNLSRKQWTLLNPFSWKKSLTVRSSL